LGSHSHDARWLKESPNQEYRERLKGTEMARQVAVVLYVAAMVAVIVGVDLGFFRNRFWERLMANIGIVLVFAAFYWRFLRVP
jgi:type IV secretory pathway VirB2 component (pilin)